MKGTDVSRPFSPPPVADLWKYWSPRFLAFGVDPIILGQMQEEITHWAEWYPTWTRYATEVEDWGERALAAGHGLTAGDFFVRAAMLHHFAGMVAVDNVEIYKAAERQRIESYARAAPLLKVPAERIEVPFQGVDMPGYLRIPPSDDPVPLVVIVQGWEGSKESTANAAPLVERGMATLTMDFPGIGETLHHLPMTGDYGPPVAATLDVLEQRDEIDASRMALHGGSRGSLLAARAAAYDDRVAALATVGVGFETRRFNWAAGMRGLEDSFVQFVFHADSLESANERLTRDDLCLEGIGGRITCPTLIVTDDDRAERFEGSRRFYDELAGPKEIAVVPGAQRNGTRRIYIVRPLVADWLADRLVAGVTV